MIAYNTNVLYQSAPAHQIYHYVYLTTNLINGKIYIGKRSRNNKHRTSMAINTIGWVVILQDK